MTFSPNLSSYSLPQNFRTFAIALILFAKTDCAAFSISKCCYVSKSTTQNLIPNIGCINRDFAPSASAHDDMSGMEVGNIPYKCAENAAAKDESRCFDLVDESPSKSTNPGQSSKGTLYITVGPQCSGKTTILRNLFGKSFHKAAGPDETGMMGLDVTIDDQEMVYIPVPSQLFLEIPHSKDSNTTSDYSHLLDRDILGQTIRQRINDPSQEELTLVVQRLGGILSGEEFKARILRNNEQQSNRNNNINNSFEMCHENSIGDELVDALEFVSNISSNNNKFDNCTVNSIAHLPKTVDLFIVESIFRERPLHYFWGEANTKSKNFTYSTNITHAPSALDAAQHILKHHANATLPQRGSNTHKCHPSHAPMAWGNTNTRPREYKIALEAAEISGRPVEFIVFGGVEACEMIRNHVTRREYRKMSHDREKNSSSTHYDASMTETDDNTIISLPKTDLQTLLRRNLHRFLQTGRYIPSKAIADAIIRTESLLASAAAEAKKQYERSREEGKCQDEYVLTDPKNMIDAKFILDLELAKLAGFKLNPDRTVSSCPKKSEVIIDGRKDYRNKSLGGGNIGSRSGRAVFGRGGANYQRPRGNYSQRGERRNTKAPVGRGRYQIGKNFHQNEGRGRRSGFNRCDRHYEHTGTQEGSRGYKQKQGKTQQNFTPGFQPYHDAREVNEENA